MHTCYLCGQSFPQLSAELAAQHQHHIEEGNPAAVFSSSFEEWACLDCLPELHNRQERAEIYETIAAEE